MKTTPLLYLGDNPATTTGLGRILRDLAIRTAEMPQFRVGVMGRGGTGSRHLPFTLFPFGEDQQWGENLLEGVWLDFAGRERGIVLTVWDATRLSWLALPQTLPPSNLRTFFLDRPFELWGYFPVDAMSPNGGLSAMAASTVAGYDRVLAYTKFGAEVLSRTLGREVDWAPHGIDTTTFSPQDRGKGREWLRGSSGGRWGLCEGDLLVGVVGINQARKDWGLVAGVAARLKEKYGPKFKTWWHTDILERSFSSSFPALAADFGLGNSVFVSTDQWRDDELALGYSACDLTLAPGMEGFGFPIAESMACGVPVITGEGHGGSELVTDAGGMRVPRVGWRVEGPHNSVRSVHDPQRWAEAVEALYKEQRDPRGVRETVRHLDWTLLWKGVWEKRLRAWGEGK